MDFVVICVFVFFIVFVLMFVLFIVFMLVFVRLLVLMFVTASVPFLSVVFLLSMVLLAEE